MTTPWEHDLEKTHKFSMTGREKDYRIRRLIGNAVIFRRAGFGQVFRLMDVNGCWAAEYLTEETPYVVMDVTGAGLPSPALAVWLMFPDGKQKVVYIHVHTLESVQLLSECKDLCNP